MNSALDYVISHLKTLGRPVNSETIEEGLKRNFPLLLKKYCPDGNIWMLLKEFLPTDMKESNKWVQKRLGD